MQTISETRRQRLELLIKKHGSIAEVNTAIGWARTDATLSLIRNAIKRKGRKTPFQMGDAMAREIEEALKLPEGWMDTKPSAFEQYGEHDPRVKAMQLLESMPPEQWHTAVRLLDALAQPTTPTLTPIKATGTYGK